MNLKPIRTESDHQQALKEIEQIFDAEPNTPEYEKLDILTTLVEVYEQLDQAKSQTSMECCHACAA